VPDFVEPVGTGWNLGRPHQDAKLEKVLTCRRLAVQERYSQAPRSPSREKARPSHCLAIVTAAENHFLAANDNHDIANRRIRITPDRNFRRSVFAGHRNIFFARKRVSISLPASHPVQSRATGKVPAGFVVGPPFGFAPAPMCIFARRVKHPLEVGEYGPMVSP
jgi:hypothetical protein